MFKYIFFSFQVSHYSASFQLMMLETILCSVSSISSLQSCGHIAYEHIAIL